MPSPLYSTAEKHLLAQIAGSIIAGIVARDRCFVSRDPFSYRNGATAAIPTAFEIAELVLAKAMSL